MNKSFSSLFIDNNLYKIQDLLYLHASKCTIVDHHKMRIKLLKDHEIYLLMFVHTNVRIRVTPLIIGCFSISYHSINSFKIFLE